MFFNQNQCSNSNIETKKYGDSKAHVNRVKKQPYSVAKIVSRFKYLTKHVSYKRMVFTMKQINDQCASW